MMECLLLSWFLLNCLLFPHVTVARVGKTRRAPSDASQVHEKLQERMATPQMYYPPQGPPPPPPLAMRNRRNPQFPGSKPPEAWPHNLLQQQPHPTPHPPQPQGGSALVPLDALMDAISSNKQSPAKEVGGGPPPRPKPPPSSPHELPPIKYSLIENNDRPFKPLTPRRKPPPFAPQQHYFPDKPHDQGTWPHNIYHPVRPQRTKQTSSKPSVQLFSEDIDTLFSSLESGLRGNTQDDDLDEFLDLANQFLQMIPQESNSEDMDDEVVIKIKGDEGEVPIKEKKVEEAKGGKGDKGDKGDKGAMGDSGRIGLQGRRGPKGDKGDEGPKGDQGIPGPSGQTGMCNEGNFWCQTPILRRQQQVLDIMRNYKDGHGQLRKRYTALLGELLDMRERQKQIRAKLWSSSQKENGQIVQNTSDLNDLQKRLDLQVKKDLEKLEKLRVDLKMMISESNQELRMDIEKNAKDLRNMDIDTDLLDRMLKMFNTTEIKLESLKDIDQKHSLKNEAMTKRFEEALAEHEKEMEVMEAKYLQNAEKLNSEIEKEKEALRKALHGTFVKSGQQLKNKLDEKFAQYEKETAKLNYRFEARFLEREEEFKRSIETAVANKDRELNQKFQTNFDKKEEELLRMFNEMTAATKQQLSQHVQYLLTENELKLAKDSEATLAANKQELDTAFDAKFWKKEQELVGVFETKFASKEQIHQIVEEMMTEKERLIQEAFDAKLARQERERAEEVERLLATQKQQLERNFEAKLEEREQQLARAISDLEALKTLVTEQQNFDKVLDTKLAENNKEMLNVLETQYVTHREVGTLKSILEDQLQRLVDQLFAEKEKEQKKEFQAFLRRNEEEKLVQNVEEFEKAITNETEFIDKTQAEALIKSIFEETFVKEEEKWLKILQDRMKDMETMVGKKAMNFERTSMHDPTSEIEYAMEALNATVEMKKKELMEMGSSVIDEQVKAKFETIESVLRDGFVSAFVKNEESLRHNLTEGLANTTEYLRKLLETALWEHQLERQELDAEREASFNASIAQSQDQVRAEFQEALAKVVLDIKNELDNEVARLEEKFKKTFDGKLQIIKSDLTVKLDLFEKLVQELTGISNLKHTVD